MRYKFIGATAFSLMLGLGAPAPGDAQGMPVFDATSFGQLVRQLATDGQMLTQLQQQLTAQLDMLRSLPSTIMPGIGQLVYATQNVMGQIQSIRQIGSGLQSQIEGLYPTNYSGQSFQSVLATLGQMTDSTRAAYENSMQLQDQINSQQPQLQNAVQQAEAEGMAAPGPTAAMQSGDQILGSMSAQLTGMQDTMTAGYRAQEQEALQRQASDAAAAQVSQQAWSGDNGFSSAPMPNPFPGVNP